MTLAQYHNTNKRLEQLRAQAKKEDFHLVEMIPNLRMYQYKNQCYFISLKEYTQRFKRVIKKDFW